MVPRLASVSRPLSVLFALLVPFLAAAGALPPSRDAIVPRLTVDAGDALPLTALEVDVVVRGHLSRTTCVATFHNDRDADVNGKFFLPLPDGAAVTDMGLFFDGRLRHAVAIERERARIAYERVVHQNVDPLLAEWSTRPGFNYEIYPIPAKGDKKVSITFDRELRLDGSDMIFDLDLRTYATLERLKLRVDADSGAAIRIARTTGPVNARQIYTLDERDTPLDLTIRVSQPFRPREALVEWNDAEKRSYASVPFALGNDAPPVVPASDVVVFWDASGSATAAKRAQLTDFLEAFLMRQAPFVAVTIVPFHVALESPIAHPRLPRNEAARRLRAALSATTYAGASDYQLLLQALPEATRALRRDARIVIAGDGMATTGARGEAADAVERLKRSAHPLTVVSARGDVDGRFLRSIAAASGGWYIALGETPVDGAVAEAMRAPRWFTIDAAPGAEVAESGRTALRDGAVLVTNIRSSAASPELALRFDGKRSLALPYATRIVEGAPGIVRSAWARAKLASLLGESGNDDALAKHGTTYTLLTPRTSLIVLDRWRDYLTFNIPMPPDVQAIFEAETSPEWRISQIPATGGKSWTLRGRIDHEGAGLPGATVIAVTPSRTIQSITDAAGLFWIVFPERPKEPVTLRVEMAGMQSITRVIDPSAANGAFIEAQMRIAAVAEAITVTAASPEAPGESSGLQPGRGAIWDREPCTECERLLRKAASVEALDELGDAGIEYRSAWIEAIVDHLASLPPAAQFEFYTRARSHVGGSKRFHVRAAEVFHKTDPAAAVRVLTDAVEQNGDDAPFIRLVARILEGWGSQEAALHLFERSTDVAPQQPQSWRELIFARVRTGRTRGLDEIEHRYREAPLDRRFREIEGIFENELRQLKASGAKATAVPDLEISCVWDSNYSYIDLWIHEPDGSEVSWSHKKGKVGIFHGGFTQGYGPQVYEAKTAADGTYRVSLDYYAHDTTELFVDAMALVEIRLKGRRVVHVPVFLDDREAEPEVARVTVPGKIEVISR